MGASVRSGLRGHRKTKRLAARLGIRVAEAVGLLVNGWDRADQELEEGVFKGWSNLEISEAFGWEGEADEFVRVMGEVGWLDANLGGLAIHDWEDHQGMAYLKRQFWKAEKRKQRSKLKGDVPDNRDTGQESKVTCPGHVQDMSGKGKRERGDREREEKEKRGGNVPDNVPDNLKLAPGFSDVWGEMIMVNIIGPDKLKREHACGWLRRFSVSEVCQRIKANPGLHIYDLDKAAFRGAEAKPKDSKPTVQFNTKSRKGPPCPRCRETGMVSIKDEKGHERATKCTTCDGKGRLPEGKVLDNSAIDPHPWRDPDEAPNIVNPGPGDKVDNAEFTRIAEETRKKIDKGAETSPAQAPEKPKAEKPRISAAESKRRADAAKAALKADEEIAAPVGGTPPAESENVFADIEDPQRDEPPTPDPVKPNEDPKDETFVEEVLPEEEIPF